MSFQEDRAVLGETGLAATLNLRVGLGLNKWIRCGLLGVTGSPSQ